MAETTGVLIVRDDGVIDIPEAEPWPAQLAGQVEQLLDTLVGPRRAEPEPTADD